MVLLLTNFSFGERYGTEFEPINIRFKISS